MQISSNLNTSLTPNLNPQNALNQSNLNFSDELNLALNLSNLNPNLNIYKTQAVSQISNLQSPIIQAKFGSAYGYSVDKDGFMGSDFNKAANLPENFKLHKSTIDEFIRAAKLTTNCPSSLIFPGSGGEIGIFQDKEVFENIDIADTISQYYELFSKITKGVISDDKSIYSYADLERLPKGYSFIKQNTDDDIPFFSDLKNIEITNFYKTNDEINEAFDLYQTLDSVWIKFNVKMLDFSSQSMQTRNLSGLEAKFSFNPDMSMYQNPNGYAKEALFISFIKSENPRILNGGTTKLKPEVLENNLNIGSFPTGEEMYRKIFQDFFKKDEFKEAINQFLKTLQADMLKSAFNIGNKEDYDNFINKTVDRFEILMAKTRV